MGLRGPILWGGQSARAEPHALDSEASGVEPQGLVAGMGLPVAMREGARRWSHPFLLRC
jgi:hypothetical protein